MSIQSFRLKLNALWQWLAEAQYAWLASIVICTALVVSLRPHTTEPVIRLTGLVLQLLGIGTVIWGISETRTFFGHPSFTSKFKAWLSRIPLLRRKIVLGVAVGTLEIAPGSASAHVTSVAATHSIDDRLNSLEQNVSLINERISQTQNEMSEEFRKISDALKLEEQLRQTEEKVILEKLEATGTGGIHISFIGAVWLFVGVILSTASFEIAKLLK
jgi:hypothetical protein